MYLQGDLQIVFDALFNLGVIEPVLEMDWVEAMDKVEDDLELDTIIAVVNRCQTNTRELMYQLEKFDQKRLSFLAMEVAREYADFHSRKGLH